MCSLSENYSLHDLEKNGSEKKNRNCDVKTKQEIPHKTLPFDIYIKKMLPNIDFSMREKASLMQTTRSTRWRVLCNPWEDRNDSAKTPMKMQILSNDTNYIKQRTCNDKRCKSSHFKQSTQ
jgi:hypothetical protein